jgi:hypothetical protein
MPLQGRRIKIKDALASLRVEPQHAMLDRIGDASADPIVVDSPGVPDGSGFLVVGLDSS